MKKRLLANLIALCLLVGLIPSPALAAESNNFQVTELESLTVTDSEGNMVSLLDGEQSIHLGTTYSFAVKFSDLDHVGKVYITSTKQGETEVIEAVWDGEAGAYVTNGIFADDPTYLPGRIGVRYTEEIPQISVDGQVDWTAMNDALAGKSVVTITENTTNSVQASVDISSLLGDINQTVLDLSVDVFDAETGANLNEFLGQYQELEQMVQYAVDGGGYEVYLDYTDPSAYALILKDVSQNKWVKMVLKEGGDAYRTLAETAIFLDDVGTISSFAYEYLSIQESAAELREEIDQSAWLDEENKEDLLNQVDAYENDRHLFQLSMAVLPVVAVATVGSGPIGMAFNALLGVLGASAGFFWEHRVGMISGGVADEASFTNDAHGIPIRYSNEADITESGTYYVHEDFYSTIIIYEGINVTLCIHGGRCTVQNNGGTLILMDCQNVQNEWASSSSQSRVTIYGGRTVIEEGHFAVDVHGGTLVVNGGQVEVNRAREGSTVEIYDGTFDRVYNDGGNVTFYDGFANLVENESGNMDIRGGIVEPTYKYLSFPAVTNREEGELTIRSGAEIRASQGESAVVNRDSKLTIMGGTIIGSDLSLSVFDDRGEVTVYDGTIIGGLSGGAESTIEINGGKFYAESGAAVSSSGQKSNLTISDGEFYAASGGICVDTGGNNDPGSINTAGHTLIKGGTFVSLGGSCLANTGILTICGGTFTSQENEGSTAACLENSHYGETKIYGGVFSQSGGPCVVNLKEYSSLDMFSGSLVGSDGASGICGETCTLYIGEDTSIEIDTQERAFGENESGDKIAVTFEAEDGYFGDLTYYLSKGGQGVTIPLENAAKVIDQDPSYVRFTAAGSLPNPAPGEEETYTVSFLPNGGTGSMSSLTVTQGEHLTLPACGFTAPDGQLFAHWALNAPDGNIYSAGADIGPVGSDLTFYAVWEADATTPTLPHGGGSSSDGPVTHTVSTPSDVRGGAISVSSRNASQGTRVTITVNPDEGYELGTLTVTDASGNEIAVRSRGNHQYTFTMPRSRVTIEATFAEIVERPAALAFTDVPTSAYYYDAICWSVENGVTNGTSATTFSPDTGVSRAQMVTFLWRAAGSPAPVATVNPFTDVDAGDYYYNAVLWAVEKGITNGTSATTFSPESAVSRAQAVTFLWRSASSPTASSVNFDDVASDAYYAQAVTWAARESITVGTGGNNFSPDVAVSRAQAVTFLYRHMG